MVTSSAAAAANIYPLASYTFGTKEPKMEKDTSVADRLARMKVNYMKEGMRTSVEAILLEGNCMKFIMIADLAEAVSADELARYLDLKKLDERVYMFEAVSAYDMLGIKESVEWPVEVMERSKRTEMLRARAGVTGPASA